LIIVIATFWRFVAAAGSNSEMVESAALGREVVVSWTENVVYLMDPGGGIDAIAVDTGKTCWHTTEASQPLLQYDTRLVALAEPTDSHSLTIVALDSANGALASSGRLALPEDVRAEIDDRLGTSFRIDAQQTSAGVRIDWRYVHRVLRGRRNPEGSPSPLIREGSALFNPAAREIKSTMKRESATGADDLERAGSYLIRLQPSEASPNSTMVKRWSGANRKPLPVVEIPGAPNSLAISADGEFARVIIGQRIELGVVYYLWRTYSLTDGRPAGEVELPVRTAPFFVSKGALLYVAPPIGRRMQDGWINQPPRVVAADLGSRRERWSHPLRDTSAQGPLPPTPPRG